MSDLKNYSAASSGPDRSGDPVRPRPGRLRRFFGGRFKRIWIGADGLRSGWAALLFVMIVGGLIAGAAFIAHLLHHLPPRTTEIIPTKMLIGEIVMILAGLVATKVMSLIDKRSWLDYGLRAPHRAAHLAQGLFFGVLAMSLMMATLRYFHAVTIEPSGMQLGPLIQSAAVWAALFLLVGFNEELSFRGYVFFRLLRGVGPVVATLVTAAIFALTHMGNPGETVYGIASVAAAGIVFCLAVWRTGSLWWIIGFHAAWDWSQSFVFGVADSGAMASGHWLTSHTTGPAWLSGGAAGPEGSILMLPMMAVLACVIVGTLPRNGARRA
ncbi:hypothetical protein B0G83_12096 [Paraburkholderia sp. BL21I4N1]|nr:hypothetical protein B0G83_12096 [Paraburkholderia sp. BL21I4N1]